MADLDDFAEQDRLRRLIEPVRGSPYSPPPPAPNGWQPGVELDGQAGTITTRPSGDPVPQWDTLLRSWGFDPADFEVEEPVRVSTWDAYAKGEDGKIITRQLWSHRARIRRKSKDRADVDALIAEIRQRKASKRGTLEGASCYVLTLSDMQIGKGEGGGTAATVARVTSVIEQSAARVKAMRKRGKGPGRIAIISGGDAIENACGWYPHQLNTIDLNRRDQVKVARRLFAAAIEAHADLADEVIFATPDSNHGENRQGGKAVTDQTDSADLEIAETLAEVFQSNPARYGHVRFVVPRDAAVVMLDLGVPVAVAHGHRAPSADGALKKQLTWWSGQAFGNQDAGAARLLLTGHYHALAMAVDHGRTWIQCPALDGGSRWLTDKTGQHSPSGRRFADRRWDGSARLARPSYAQSLNLPRGVKSLVGYEETPQPSLLDRRVSPQALAGFLRGQYPQMPV